MSNKNNLKKKINYNKILKNNEEFIYDFKFNLSKGSIINEDILKETKTIVSKMAKDVSKKINLGFGSIDIIKTIEEPMSKFFPNYELSSKVQRKNANFKFYKEKIVQYISSSDPEAGYGKYRF